MGKNIEVGDIVTLQSGSMPMTVLSVDEGTDELVLAYSDLSANILRESLPMSCVQLTEKRWTIEILDSDIEEKNDFD